MFMQAVGVMQKGIKKWGVDPSEQVASSSNPFVFEHQEVLEAAKDYLKVYIEEEVQKIINDKQILVFTNRMKSPFVRACEDEEMHLEELTSYIERMIGAKLTEYEQAFVTYTFYNEVEEKILKRVIHLMLFHVEGKDTFQMYWFFKKVRLLLKEGEEILYTDLQEMYAAYTSKKVWQYHLEN